MGGVFLTRGLGRTGSLGFGLGLHLLGLLCKSLVCLVRRLCARSKISVLQVFMSDETKPFVFHPFLSAFRVSLS